MARVSAYLNFPRSTEAAFQFYRTVFESEFAQPMADLDLVMHVELPILAGHALKGRRSTARIRLRREL